MNRNSIHKMEFGDFRLFLTHLINSIGYRSTKEGTRNKIVISFRQSPKDLYS